MSVEDSLIQAGLTISGVIGGLIGGHQLTISIERRKEREELEKIKYLINADFTLINRQVINGTKYHKEGYEVLFNQNGVSYYVTDLNTFRDVLPNLGFQIGGFTYWDSLISSGGLIKLQPDELRIISTSHKLIISIIEQQREIFNKMALDVGNSLFSTPQTQQGKEQIFTQKIKMHFDLLFQAYKILEKNVNNVKENISWVDLKTEPILEFKGNQKDVKLTEPYVTEEGITIYPDGTRVDRKGTIL